ncbi:hypothetical protein PRIPAC_93357 [Pristionchus pacificus]|uniref:G protein-coupled receptor n=1 Tax=Pristionchus pacificus TaxID=54126 RepID=A0A2A6BBI9_PRIPA|nr:hypothetical protein PRIPAC_93357 [Pristionchus pacificus]|eukprot:PDM63248.1 G protein-coupled receptor [Pristionchus pacificus]
MDLSTTSQQVFLHSILSYTFLPISLVLNALVFVLSSKTTKLGATLKLIHAFCGVCVLLSIAHAISLAHWEHLPYAIAFFPTGSLATLDYITPIAFQLQQVAYISIICLVGYMYIHRYRTMLAASQRGNRRWKLVIAIIIAAIVQWETICLFIMKPNDKMRAKFNVAFVESYDIDFMRLYFLAVDLTEPLDPWLIFNGLGVLIEVSVLIVLIVWCGFRIQLIIVRSISSEKAKRIQRRVLRLLIFQVT